jgi:hypothetical protein
MLILKKKVGLIKCLLFEISNERLWHNSSQHKLAQAIKKCNRHVYYECNK